MNAVQKVAMGIVAIAMVTTMVLPARQTPQVINAFSSLFRGSLATAMGTGKQV